MSLFCSHFSFLVLNALPMLYNYYTFLKKSRVCLWAPNKSFFFDQLACFSLFSVPSCRKEQLPLAPSRLCRHLSFLTACCPPCQRWRARCLCWCSRRFVSLNCSLTDQTKFVQNPQAACTRYHCCYPGVFCHPSEVPQ